jgi:protein tyrosine/serine phosphatase
MRCFKCFNETEHLDEEPKVKMKTGIERKQSMRVASVALKSLEETNNVSKMINNFVKRQETVDSKKQLRKMNSMLDKPLSGQKQKDSKTHWTNKDVIRCYFCGGATCKHENWQFNKNPAIKGLHSTYINSDIIASQRPSTVLVEEYDLIESFKNANIGLIVNLQREGEHPYCGPNKGLENISGFAYDPHTFKSEDIKVRLSGWKDMSVPDSMNFMLDIVKDMTITVKENNQKVLVHCHAGYGRTGVVIACYYIYAKNIPLKEIVDHIRKTRPGCIQKSSQYKFCENFKEYVDKCRPIFLNDQMNIELFMKYQNDLLYGEECNKYEFIPKLISVVLEKMIDLLKAEITTPEEIYIAMLEPQSNSEKENTLIRLKSQINKGEWDCLVDDVTILIHLLFDWLQDNINYIISPDKMYTIFEERGLGFLIEQHIKEYHKFNAQNRKVLMDNIKVSMRTIESETLSCIALFINKIRRPTDDFRKVFNKLCILLLGKDATDMLVYSTSKLVILIEFFCIIIEYDLKDEMIIYKKNEFSYANRRKMTDYNFNMTKPITEFHIDFGKTNHSEDDIIVRNSDDEIFEIYQVLEDFYKYHKVDNMEILMKKLDEKQFGKKVKQFLKEKFNDKPIITLNIMEDIQDIKFKRSASRSLSNRLPILSKLANMKKKDRSSKRFQTQKQTKLELSIKHNLTELYFSNNSSDS